VERCTQADPAFRAELKTLIHRPPFVVDAEADIVQSLQRYMAARLGYPR